MFFKDSGLGIVHPCYSPNGLIRFCHWQCFVHLDDDDIGDDDVVDDVDVVVIDIDVVIGDMDDIYQ